MSRALSVYFLGNQGPAQQAFLAPYRRLLERFADAGTFIFSNQDPEYLACYDRDGQNLHVMRPVLVFRPHSLSIMTPFVHFCYEHQIPLTVRCGGTSFSGSSTASQGGIIVLVGHFRSILFYCPKQGIVIIEPGVTLRQLRSTVYHDGWNFPLEISTQGVAGLGGCLSTQAKGYHQTKSLIAQHIVSITLIDGTGQELEAPSELGCGAEGIFGVITRLKLQLSPLPKKRIVFQTIIHFDKLMDHFDELSGHTALASLLWQEGHATFVLEGEDWRVNGAFHHLEKIFNPVSTLPDDWSFEIPPLSHQAAIILSSAIARSRLASMLSIVDQLSQDCQLNYHIWINVLDGSLHILLYAKMDLYLFSKQVQKFSVAWANVLDEQHGFLISRHGVGPLWSPFLSPFYTEEEWKMLKQFQQAFDPHQLFVRDRFFPKAGKSLEKVRVGI